MPLTKQQKQEIINIFKSVDVKALDIDLPDKNKVRWFRFGSYNGLSIACEIIKALPEPAVKAKKVPKAA